MTNTPTPEQIADKLEELAKRWPEATMLREAAALIRRPSIRPDGEMVERAAIRLCALDLGNEGFWKTIGEEDRNAYRDEARDVLTAALAAMPGGVDVKPLDWQTTYVNRGDGQKEESGWEADNGFNQWYSVEMYFGTDSYGWRVMFDCDVIADHDDPERAKAAAQEHFASRILSRLTPSIGAQGWRPIESAPKDGTIIDVWLGDAELADIDFYCTPGTRRSCGWSWRDGKFRPLGGLSVTMPTFVQPTHWQPLPAPPAEGK